MGSELLLRAVLFGTLSIGSLAQNITVPAAMNGIEGGGGTSIPFGTNQSCRYQCVYDAEELPWTGPRVITGLMLRPDGVLTATPAKGFLDISVLVSTTTRNSATASAVFADNYGVDATWVISRQPLMLPAQPALASTAQLPRPANIPLVFQVPWAYGLTPATTSLPAPRNLLIEIHIHFQPAGPYRLDNLSSCTATQVTFGQVQAPCEFTAGQPVTVSGDNSMLAGLDYSWQVANMPPSMPFLLAVNLTNTGGLLGNPAWPLPYPMFDPANPSQPSPALAVFGFPAPGCYLNIDPVVTFSGQANTAGAGAITTSLPAGRQFVGTTFYTQAIVLAPTVNPLRFITSAGRSSTICGPLGVARIHAFYNGAATPPPTPPTSGQVGIGVGMVFEVM
ncbi:MAG: hypothetical protein MUC36_20695 [Planctomycetes bacterium]|jgi:hypothetical protein|nr:hypothetical protein [Planctomycetota bacterium]